MVCDLPTPASALRSFELPYRNSWDESTGLSSMLNPSRDWSTTPQDFNPSQPPCESSLLTFYSDSRYLSDSIAHNHLTLSPHTDNHDARHPTMVYPMVSDDWGPHTNDHQNHTWAAWLNHGLPDELDPPSSRLYYQIHQLDHSRVQQPTRQVPPPSFALDASGIQEIGDWYPHLTGADALSSRVESSRHDAQHAGTVDTTWSRGSLQQPHGEAFKSTDLTGSSLRAPYRSSLPGLWVTTTFSKLRQCLMIYQCP